VYVTDEKGRKLSCGAVATEKAVIERRLKPFLRGGLSVAIEAGNQTAWIHEVLAGMGAKVTVVNPAKVKAIAESRRKTDKIDARILCELLRLDALPQPSCQGLRPGRYAVVPSVRRKRWQTPQDPCRHDLEQYIHDYLAAASVALEKDTPLFRSFDRRKQITARGIHRVEVHGMLKRRLRSAGLPDNLSSHSFRATTATDLLTQGISLEDVQYLLGHSDPRTTKLYDRRRKKSPGTSWRGFRYELAVSRIVQFCPPPPMPSSPTCHS